MASDATYSRAREACLRTAAVALAVVAAIWSAAALAPPAEAAITLVGANTAQSASGSSITVANPAGPGQVVVVALQASGSTVISVPTGWSSVYSTAAPYGYSLTIRRVAGASEPASYTFALGASRAATAEALAWNGVESSSPIDTYGTSANFGTSTSATAPGVFTSVANDAVESRVTWGARVTSTAPAGLSGVVSVGAGSSLTTQLGYFMAAPTGMTVGQTFTSSSAADWGTSSIALRPDTTPPAAPTITSAPTSPGNQTAPSWSFTGEAFATFQCRVDRGATVIQAWAPCTSPDSVGLAGQPDGTYTFSVRATDEAGNTGPAATGSYTLDTIAPSAPSITSVPPSPSNSTNPSWSFTGEAGATFKCTLTGPAGVVAGPSTCSSPASYSLAGDPDGTYTLSITATDIAGNTSGPATSNYVLDTTSPAAPTIAGGPGASGSNVNPSWSFTGAAGDSFECRLDRGSTTIVGWTACTSPQGYDLSLEPDATYTFSVRATDQAGNTGPAATSDYALTTARPPAPTIDSSPSSPGRSANPAWSFSSSQGGDTFECQLDGPAGVVSAWAACPSPQSYALGGMPDGAYTLEVRATNGVSTGPETTSTYVYDTTAPAAPAIGSSPPAVGSSLTPSWSFSDEPGASFRCSLTGPNGLASGPAACSSPVSYSLAGDPDGTYTFSVTATDAAGNTSAAATSAYVLDTTPPAAPTITATPGAVGSNVSPWWAFTAEAGATTQCKLALGGTVISDWATCATPRSYDLSSRPDGTYTFSVRAVDAAGNVSPTTVSDYQLLTHAPGAPTIVATPGATGNDRTPSWSFTGDPASTLQCSFARAGVTVSWWTPCTSPFAYDLAGQPDGPYTFSVRAVNAVGAASSIVSSDYLLDTTPPATPVITRAPRSPGRDQAPSWDFKGDADATLECRLERGAHVVAGWATCTKAKRYDLRREPDGDYTFEVRARDAAGNRSAAATRTYVLDTTPPSAPTITAGPGPSGSDRSPRWSFSGENGARFECRLLLGGNVLSGWAPCASPGSYDLSHEPDGDYTFEVRATDAAGNVSATATSAYRLGNGAAAAAPAPATTPPAPPAAPAPRPRPHAVPRLHAAAAPSLPRVGLAAPHHAAPPVPTFAFQRPRRLTHRTPAARPAPVHRIVRHRSPSGGGGPLAVVAQIVREAVRIVVRNAGKAVFPTALLLIVIAFLSIQGRMDRNDPKLALAPAVGDPALDFGPPPSID